MQKATVFEIPSTDDTPRLLTGNVSQGRKESTGKKPKGSRKERERWEGWMWSWEGLEKGKAEAIKRKSCY